MLRRNKIARGKKKMNAETLKRSGRPDQQASEELLRHIVDTATRLFIEQGYAATSIEQIASAAGSGKQTLYRRFASKEGLFIEVINRQGQRLIDLAVTTGETVDNPVAALKDSCRLLFDFVLTPDMIRLQRILMAEIPRFPDLGETVLENCMRPLRDMLNRLLAAARLSGRSRSRRLFRGRLGPVPARRAIGGAHGPPSLLADCV
jgi:AcrR family transcriptional regulator